MTPSHHGGSAARLSDAELEAMLARAAEEGARRALNDVGLGGKDAVLTIHDMRSLLECIQFVRRTAVQTAVHAHPTGIRPAVERGRIRGPNHRSFMAIPVRSAISTPVVMMLEAEVAIGRELRHQLGPHASRMFARRPLRRLEGAVEPLVAVMPVKASAVVTAARSCQNVNVSTCARTNHHNLESIIPSGPTL